MLEPSERDLTVQDTNSLPIYVSSFKLRNNDVLWDMGCGCGMLELALQDLGWQGHLIGTDIHKPCIDWTQKNIATCFQRHEFIHMNIYNDEYCRNGTLNAQEWLDSFIYKDFNVVVAKSLFTHVLPDELNVYLRGLAERLKAGGKALLTFFILTKEQERLAASGKNRISFQHYEEGGRYAVRRPSAPSAAVAYKQDYLLDCLRSAGFKVDNRAIYYGAWTGNSDGLSFQDLIVVEK